MEQIVAFLAKSALGALALVILAGLIYEAFHKSSEQIAADYETELVTNVQGYFQGGVTARNYSGLTNQVAIQAALVPKGMLLSGDTSTLKGPWPNSTVTLASANSGMGMTATWNNVQSDDCATFARSQSPTSLTVNGTTISPTSSTVAADIATACNASTTSSTLTTMFQHDR